MGFGNMGRMLEQMEQMHSRMMVDMRNNVEQMERNMNAANPGTDFPAGSNISYSSSQYSCTGGPNGQSVQYSSTTRGSTLSNGQRVAETQRNYRDSSGYEKIGISRTLGDRGRNLVRDRAADGTERRTDNVKNVDDVRAFEEEWQRAAGSSNLRYAF